MKAARYDPARDDIAIVEAPVPGIGDGEFLLRPKSIGICASELIPSHLKKGGSLGHELAGEVLETGKNTKGVAVGDRVFVLHHVPCLDCHFCRRGRYTMCEGFKEFGFDPTGYAEFARIKERHARIGALKLPDHVSFDEGCLIEPISGLVSAVRKAAIGFGDTVLVLGAGFVGLAALRLIRLFGAGLIVIVDPVREKLERAKEFGADVVFSGGRESVITGLREVNEGRLADIVLITAPAIEAVSDGIAFAEKGGTVIQFGGTSPHESATIVPYDFIKSELKYAGIYSGSHIDARMTLGLISKGMLKVKDLVTDRFTLDRLKEAIEYKKRTPNSLKVVIRPNG